MTALIIISIIITSLSASSASSQHHHNISLSSSYCHVVIILQFNQHSKEPIRHSVNDSCDFHHICLQPHHIKHLNHHPHIIIVLISSSRDAGQGMTIASLDLDQALRFMVMFNCDVYGDWRDNLESVTVTPRQSR